MENEEKLMNQLTCKQTDKFKKNKLLLKKKRPLRSKKEKNLRWPLKS